MVITAPLGHLGAELGQLSPQGQYLRRQLRGIAPIAEPGPDVWLIIWVSSWIEGGSTSVTVEAPSFAAQRQLEAFS